MGRLKPRLRRTDGWLLTSKISKQFIRLWNDYYIQEDYIAVMWVKSDKNDILFEDDWDCWTSMWKEPDYTIKNMGLFKTQMKQNHWLDFVLQITVFRQNYLADYLYPRQNFL
jgi:hypothetical protein